MNLDARGLPLTAANEAAVQHFDEVIAEYLRFGRSDYPYPDRRGRHLPG